MNEDVQGNLNVSRHLHVGIDAEVGGDLNVGHNLKIGGWIEAKNIKGPLKGLFSSEESLKVTYPTPESGWIALVGDTLPAMVYRAYGGEWNRTGQMGGTLTVDLADIEKDLSVIKQLLQEGGIDWGDIENGLEVDEEGLFETFIEKIGLYPFDREVYSLAELGDRPIANIVFSNQDHKFYEWTESNTWKEKMSYNETGEDGKRRPKTGVVYICGGQLYIAGDSGYGYYYLKRYLMQGDVKESKDIDGGDSKE